MWWLLLYHFLNTKPDVGRSPCVTPQPAAPADEPATTAEMCHLSDVVTGAVTLDRGGEAVDIVVITDTTERADIIEALGWLNDTAKHLRRKGYIGTAGQEYARQHARIDALLDELERTPATQP